MNSIKHIHLFKTDIETGTVPLWVDALVDGDRDVFIKNMRKKNIVCRPFWPSMHLQDVYSKEEKLHLPISEKIADKIKNAGFKDVHNLYGGIFEWKNEEFPLVDINGEETEQVHVYSKRWGKWLRNGEKIY